MGVNGVVRKATLEDLPWVIHELKSFAEFYGTKRTLFPSEESAIAAIEDMIKNHIVYVFEKNSAPIGFIAGYYSVHPYNHDITVLSEAFWWVTPIHRNTRAGLELLNAFTEFGKKNAHWVVMTLEHKSPVRHETITKRGFKPIESTFILETDNG